MGMPAQTFTEFRSPSRGGDEQQDKRNVDGSPPAPPPVSIWICSRRLSLTGKAVVEREDAHFKSPPRVRRVFFRSPWVSFRSWYLFLRVGFNGKRKEFTHLYRSANCDGKPTMPIEDTIAERLAPQTLTDLQDAGVPLRKKWVFLKWWVPFCWF